MTILLQSCCNVGGKYYCINDSAATNYLDINQDGTYLHFYKKDSVTFSQKELWNRSKENECIIEFRGWKNYNVAGVAYVDYGIYILYIDGKYLNPGPDGNVHGSFIKEK